MRTIEKIRKWGNGKWGLLLSTFLTLVGLLFSVGNDHFSQFNYAFKEIKKDICSPDSVVNFVEITKDAQIEDPMYYFILDVSGSSGSSSKIVPLNSTINEQIYEVQASGHCTNNGFTFDVDKNSKEIKFYRFLQLRLLHALNSLYKNQKENLKYSVVLFSENPESLTIKDINDAFRLVYEQDHKKGGTTNFVKLVNFLNDNIQSAYGSASIYKRRECHLVFFSDYLHDSGNNNGQLADDEKKLTKFLWDMREKNIDIKLHYIENFAFLKSGTSDKGTPIEKYFFEIFPFSKIGIMDVDNGLINSVVSKKPLSFHYTNTVFEDTLKTIIDFKNLNSNKDFSFGLNYNTDGKDNMKQEYYLIKGKDTIHLSNHLQSIGINTGEKVTLMIQGYIPAPYKSPDIIIEDKKEGVRHVIPVVFYRNFPFTGELLLWSIGLIFLIIVVISIAGIPHVLSKIWRRIKSFFRKRNEPNRNESVTENWL